MHYKVTIPVRLTLYVNSNGDFLFPENSTKIEMYHDTWGMGVSDKEPADADSLPDKYADLGPTSDAETLIHTDMVDRIHENALGCPLPATSDDVLSSLMEIVRITASDTKLAAWFET